MSNIKFKLNLNKHPKDCEDYSLINAWNVRVSDDFSALQTEESIIKNTAFSIITDNDYKIVGVIPCNNELILFAVTKENYISLATENSCNCSIFRYNEAANNCVEVYSNLEYHKGKIKGTFTYNVNNELIIAFSEYDGLVDVPLKTINLGIFGTNEGADDLSANDGRLAVSPEIVIPNVYDYEYIPGNSYKGWYYYFIRYKINNHDYTKWYPIGNPIFVCTLKLQNIFKYGVRGYSNTETNSYILNGISDHFSDDTEIADESIKLDIRNIDDYNYFQIGFICVSKDYSKAFRTNDIVRGSSSYIYEMKISECFEDSVSDLILETYNYYNVKNIINYGNRLYISNYKEKKDPEISQSELNKIRFDLNIQELSINDIKSYNIDVDANGVVVNDKVNYDYIKKNPLLNVKINNSTIRKITTTAGNFYYGNSANYITEAYILSTFGIKYDAVVTNSTGQTTLTFTINNNSYTVIFDLLNDPELYPEPRWMISTNDFNSQININDTGKVYINTNNSFNERKLNSTLIPGEIYNFYIHFVDKYGEATKGYKLNNTVHFKIENDDTEYFPIFCRNVANDIQYLLIPKDKYIVINYHIPYSILDVSGIKLAYYNNYDASNNTYIFYDISATEFVIRQLTSNLNIQAYYLNVDHTIKWSDIFCTFLYGLGLDKYPFSYIENNNGDSLFKVPDIEVINNKCLIYQPCFNLNDFEIPEGYVGYYFSYEKFESTKKLVGVLTKHDIFEQAATTNNKYKKYNNSSTLAPNFYSAKLDIDEELNIDYNILRLDTNYEIYQDDSSLYYSNTNSNILSGKFPVNYNKIENCNTSFDTINSKINISKFKCSLNKANSVLDGRFNLGSCLNIEFFVNGAIGQIFANKNYVRAYLLNINKNIYTNKNKTLIKFTDIYSINNIQGIITRGLNGHITYQGTLIYNSNKFALSAENVIVTEEYRPYYPCAISSSLNDKWIGDIRPPIAYLQQLCYDDIFYEAKSFKNYPQALTQNIETPSSEESKLTPFTVNYIITPANSIDVFRNLYTNQDKLNPKTYLANSTTESYIYQFNKRIQRSNVIADESFTNSWRSFPVEGYKDISENKGKITNLVGVGTTFLVHTEHSLFAFNKDNILQTANNENIQLAMPDIFDVDYKEVFTSDMGMCGLQDDKAFIVGQFGYIFYDNDSHRFYKFGEGKIEQIDLNIIQFLNTYIPFHVRFAHDKERNRLLINFYYTEKDNLDYWYTISYNYLLKEWISFHNYRFSEAYNTKNILYYFEGLNELYDNDTIVDDSFKLKSRIYSVWQDINKYIRKVTTEESAYYNKFFNTGDYPNNGISPEVRLNFIVHSNYLPIKTIEYLTYKLFRRGSSEQNYYSPSNPRENKKIPYSGYKLEIYNEDVSTGKYISVSEDNRLDISVNSENAKNTSVMNYKKPWWELGNWNFNYLRDVLQGRNHDVMARLYGNYFIIAFSLLNPDNNINQKLEFEDLDVTLLADKTI